MDRYDVGEYAGLAGLVAFAGIIWLPAALLVASLALLVETNLRSRGKAPVRGVQPSIGRRFRAAAKAWRHLAVEDAA